MGDLFEAEVKRPVHQTPISYSKKNIFANNTENKIPRTDILNKTQDMRTPSGTNMFLSDLIAAADNGRSVFAQ